MYEGKIFDAIHFASDKHRQQIRKVFNYPYITHPLTLLYVTSQFTHDPDVLCAAILHDTVEDTDTSFQEIENIFGQKISDYVAILSEDKNLPRTERKEKYREKFIDASPEMCLVKSVDIYCNLKDSIKVYREDPKSEFAFHISNADWIEEKKEIIETIENNWKENPLKEQLFDLINEFSSLVHKK